MEGNVIQDIVNLHANDIKVEDAELTKEDEGCMKEAIMADDQNP